MVTKKNSLKNTDILNPLGSSRMEYFADLERKNPGITKEITWRFFARDQKTKKYVPVYDPWNGNFLVPDYYKSKKERYNARLVPPYDSLSENVKDYLNSKYHITSEKDRQRFNRSLLALPDTFSKEWIITERAVKQLPGSGKKLGLFRKSGLIPEIRNEYLLREHHRRNRSKHPLQRRH